jgi:hypothetical protein
MEAVRVRRGQQAHQARGIVPHKPRLDAGVIGHPQGLHDGVRGLGAVYGATQGANLLRPHIGGQARAMGLAVLPHRPAQAIQHQAPHVLRSRRQRQEGIGLVVGHGEGVQRARRRPGRLARHRAQLARHRRLILGQKLDAARFGTKPQLGLAWQAEIDPHGPVPVAILDNEAEPG